MIELQPFDGREVRKTTISVTNAGDGLSKSLKIDPKEMHMGETVFVVLECEVAKVRFVPIGDGEDLAREHILRAGTGTLVDKDLVEVVIEEARKRILAAEEEAKGLQQIPEIDFAEEHRNGQHKRFRKGCELCAVAKAEKEEAKAQAKLDPDAPPARARGAAKKATGATGKRAGRGRGNLTGIEGGGEGSSDPS